MNWRGLILGDLVQFLGGAIVFGGALWQMRRRDLDTEGFRLVLRSALVGGLAGAWLGNLLALLLTNSSQVAAAPWPLALAYLALPGRTWIGALVGAFVAVEWTKRRLGLHRRTGDFFALPLALGEAVGRWGCLLVGCCFGRATEASWAIFQHNAWRHPTQIYAGLAALGIAGALLYLRPRLPREGDLFRAYLVLYAGTRFVVEFWRAGDRLGPLSLAQWACLAGGAYILARWLPELRRSTAAPNLPAVDPH